METENKIIPIDSRKKKLSAAEQYKVDGILPDYMFEEIDKKGNRKTFVNCTALASHIRNNAHYIFVNDGAKSQTNTYWYHDGKYKLVSDAMLKGYIKTFIPDKFVIMRNIDEVFKNIMTDLNFVDGDAVNANEDIINFKNGLLNINTMAISPHTPDEYTTIQVDCDWEPSAINLKSKHFEKFMSELTNGDSEVRSLLLQFIGAALSNVRGYRMKKSLFMVGPGNSGKSQLKLLTERLLGPGNFANVSLRQLEDRWGPVALYNKRLAGTNDMEFISVKELANFKQVTGGDHIYAEAKGENSFSFKFSGLIWFCMNKLPRFGGDHGDWVYNRIAVVRCDNVVAECDKDSQLVEKMLTEKEYIVQVAISEFKQKVLANNDNFTLPASGVGWLDDYKGENSSVRTFYDECCVPRPVNNRDACTTKKLYDVYREWCIDNGRKWIGKGEFKKELGGMGLDKTTRDSSNIRYAMFTLSRETKEDYARIYGFDQNGS